jgi:formylglycine-generating enzyme required for sulfatase activity
MTGEVYDGWPFDAAEAARRQTKTAQRLHVPVLRSIGILGGPTVELVLIPPGEFEMGSPENEPDRFGAQEGPVHRVRITKPFYLGKCEVTQALWRAVMGTNPSEFQGERDPVENVSWEDCRDFLERLNALVRPWGAFRLPTEAEWEHAARAGSATRFYYGADPDCRELGDHAWYVANSGGRTHPVGEKRPNAWGLYDVLGNVWEWCADWYADDYFGSSPAVDPPGPATGTLRVLRGCSFRYEVRRCRIAYRVGYDPTARYYNSGLRLAADVEREAAQV